MIIWELSLRQTEKVLSTDTLGKVTLTQLGSVLGAPNSRRYGWDTYAQSPAWHFILLLPLGRWVGVTWKLGLGRTQ
jgi:hypothetical protein